MVAVGALYAGGSFALKRFATRAEEAGLDSVWCGDHLVRPVDGIAGLGVLAGCTERVTIGTAVLVAPLRPIPALVSGLLTATEAAGPRVIAGLGVGGDDPAEFGAAGVEMNGRGRQADEALELLEALRARCTEGLEGRWSEFAGVLLEGPISVPDSWVGGRSAAAVERAARAGGGYVAYLVSPEQLSRRVAGLRVAGGRLGRAWTGAVAAVCFVGSGPDRDTALARMAELNPVRAVPAGRLASYHLLGDDEQLVARAHEYVAAGVDHLILGCLPGTDTDLDRFLTAGRLLRSELAREAEREPAIRPARGDFE